MVQVAVVKLAASGQRLQMRYTYIHMYIHTYVLMYMHTYMQRTLRWPPLTAVGFLLLTFRSFYYFGATVLNLNPLSRWAFVLLLWLCCGWTNGRWVGGRHTNCVQRATTAQLQRQCNYKRNRSAARSLYCGCCCCYCSYSCIAQRT